jgi:hypothetical protein
LQNIPLQLPTIPHIYIKILHLVICPHHSVILQHLFIILQPFLPPIRSKLFLCSFVVSNYAYNYYIFFL